MDKRPFFFVLYLFLFWCFWLGFNDFFFFLIFDWVGLVFAFATMQTDIALLGDCNVGQEDCCRADDDVYDTAENIGLRAENTRYQVVLKHANR